MSFEDIHKRLDEQDALERSPEWQQSLEEEWQRCLEDMARREREAEQRRPALPPDADIPNDDLVPF
jgi:hypothetical protein